MKENVVEKVILSNVHSYVSEKRCNHMQSFMKNAKIIPNFCLNFIFKTMHWNTLSQASLLFVMLR